MKKVEPTDRILIVDDAPNTVELFQRTLAAEGYDVMGCHSVKEAVKLLHEHPVSLVITDYRMPGNDGIDLIRYVRENLKDTEIMMVTGYATVEGAVQAVKGGADEYLTKPVTDQELLDAVRRSLEKLQLRRAGNEPAGATDQTSYGLIGESEAIQKVRTEIARAANSQATVLIYGECGTGKELVARAIHYGSSRASAPFVPVNCGCIPEGLLESELFGHVKGAFTGATGTRAGFFHTADRGTIFLDEVGDTSLPMQAKLLRVLQEKEVCMVGASRTRKVDVRVVAATNKNLRERVDKGAFREDLFFRLNVIVVELPELSERGNDVLLLAGHFIDKYAREHGKRAPRFSDRALEVLRHYEWPGNVRELENLVQRLVVMTDYDIIDVTDLPSHMRFSGLHKIGENRTLADVEKEHIARVLHATGGNRTRAASILGIDRKTLRDKLKRYSIG